MRFVCGLVLVICVSSTASAQSAYVGASLFGDIIRVSGSSYGEFSGNGETFGGALRAGMPLGSQWGVELEFARSGEIDASPEYQILPAGLEGLIGSGSLEFFPDGQFIFPIPQITSERQLSTISTLLWRSHELSDRVSLVYLGGVAFTRTELDFRVSYEDFPLPPSLGLPLPFPLPRRVIESKSVSYDADVTVGFEGRIGMTEHLRFAPGIRMQTAAGGWAIRPGVGLQWMF
jgi:hypothetical protein